LQSVYRVSEGVWDSGTLNVTGSGERFEMHPTGFVRQEISNTSIPLDRSTFSGVSLKTNQMQLSEIAARVEDADSDTERRTLTLALQKRYSTLFLPFIIGLFTAPFALGMERKGRVVSIAYGVGLWLVLIAVISGFDQLGLVGTLLPWMAVWSPLIVFSMLGIYLLSRVRT